MENVVNLSREIEYAEDAYDFISLVCWLEDRGMRYLFRKSPAAFALLCADMLHAEAERLEGTDATYGDQDPMTSYLTRYANAGYDCHRVRDAGPGDYSLAGMAWDIGRWFRHTKTPKFAYIRMPVGGVGSPHTLIAELPDGSTIDLCWSENNDQPAALGSRREGRVERID